MGIILSRAKEDSQVKVVIPPYKKGSLLILQLFSYLCSDSDSNKDSVSYVGYDTIGYRHHKYEI